MKPIVMMLLSLFLPLLLQAQANTHNAKVNLIPPEPQQTTIVPSQHLMRLQQSLPVPSTNIPVEADNLLEKRLYDDYMQQNWQDLAKVLPVYRRQVNHDEVLADFTEAAMLRATFYSHSALKLYERILAVYPDYHFVRLAYAQALFEDYQYREADKQFSVIPIKGLHPNTVKLLKNYQAQIKQRLKPQLSIGFNYEKNNNVNNASNIKTIQVNGLTWQKTENSLPQSATGLRYRFGLSTIFPLGGNNRFRMAISSNGIYYPKASDYNENTLRLSMGYEYTQQRHTWLISPYYEYNLYGGKPYSQGKGIKWQYHYRPNRNWEYQVEQNMMWLRYVKLSDYDMWHYGLSFAIQYMQPNYVLYSAMGYGHDHTQAPEYRHHRKWIILGGQYVWHNQFGIQLTLSHSQRDDEIAHSYVSRTQDIKRKDKSNTIQIGIFRPKWQWNGIVPMLNWQYSRTESNIPELYQKQTQQWFIGVEKGF